MPKNQRVIRKIYKKNNPKSLLEENRFNHMSESDESLKKSLKEQSDKLAKLGMELSKSQFSYKVESKTSRKYWQKRIDIFKKYSEKSLEYYNQIYTIMKLVNKKESQIFLLQISKFQQMRVILIEIMGKIEKNPTIIDTKDKQQSTWSKEIKLQIIEHSNKCLEHETNTNTTFREFYDKYLKKLLDDKNS